MNQNFDVVKKAPEPVVQESKNIITINLNNNGVINNGKNIKSSQKLTIDPRKISSDGFIKGFFIALIIAIIVDLIKSPIIDFIKNIIK